MYFLKTNRLSGIMIYFASYLSQLWGSHEQATRVIAMYLKGDKIPSLDTSLDEPVNTNCEKYRNSKFADVIMSVCGLVLSDMNL